MRSAAISPHDVATIARSEIDLLRAVVRDAEKVALYDWGTSCSEDYHNLRMASMHSLRATLKRLQCEVARDQGGRPCR